MSKYQPMYDNILVKPIKAKEQTLSGIYIPNAGHNAEVAEGEVVAVGHGRIASEKIVPLTVNVGDIVIYRKMTEVKLDSDGEELFLISEGVVLAIESDSK